MEDLLELINVETIVKEHIVPYKGETVRRYFREEVLFSHERESGVAFMSYQGSVKVRYNAMKRIARMGSKRITLETVGRLFQEVSGPEDEFIVSRLRNDEPLEKIIEQFVGKVREIMPNR